MLARSLLPDAAARLVVPPCCPALFPDRMIMILFDRSGLVHRRNTGPGSPADARQRV
jgi:hypothetical protein